MKIINEGTAPILVLYTEDNDMCKGAVTFTGMVFINQNLNFINGTDMNTWTYRHHKGIIPYKIRKVA